MGEVRLYNLDTASQWGHGWLARATGLPMKLLILETAVDCLEDQGIASQTGTWFPGLKQQNSK